MILISSSAYVVNEFQLELGKIPPCFLPLGNKKLVEHQVYHLRQHYPNDKIFVSLPEKYELSQTEKKLLVNLNVGYIAVPDYFTLAESVSYVLNVAECNHGALKIMYGDTLILDLPHQNCTDILAISFSQDGYNWFIEDVIDDIPLIWCGLYIFSSKQKLLQCLALNRKDFVQAIQAYRKQIPVKLYQCKEWFDLGHINTYYRSRAVITTQRSFNELKIENGVLYKTGKPDYKIKAEALWFKSIPSILKVFTPQLIEASINSENKIFYALEYLPNLPLNELFVHGKNQPIEWKLLFIQISYFLGLASNYKISKIDKVNIQNDFISLVKEKTISRLKDYSDLYNISLEKPNFYAGKKLPSLQEIYLFCIEKTLVLDEFPAILHGDLCFSNILFDSRTQRIKVIDPRAINNCGEFSLLGDQKYDLAKLTHSIIGLYDHIIAGRYQLISIDTAHVEIVFDIDKRIIDIQKIFMSSVFLENIVVKDILPLVILLFLSMLPLHSDRPDRQKAMLINALRLYVLNHEMV